MGCSSSMHQTIASSKEINDIQYQLVNLTEWERKDYHKRLEKRKKRLNLTIHTSLDLKLDSFII
jgi:hypothetical protein